MRKRLLLLTLLALSAGRTQTSPQALLTTRIYSITSAWPSETHGCTDGVINNQSNATRRNNNHAFTATGIGTWTVKLQYSNVSCNGPWSDFGAEATVTQATSSGKGWASGYAPWLKFTFSGANAATVTVMYFGVKDAPFPGFAGTVNFPISWIGQLGDKPVIDSREYVTFADAVTAAANKTLLLATTVTLAAGTTIPATVNVRVENGGGFTCAGGQALTINGSFEAGLHQTFFGNCTVTLNKVAQVYPQWWGAKGDALANDTAAIQSAMAAATGTVKLAAGTYLVSVASGDYALSLPTNVNIEGSGIAAATLKLVGGAGAGKGILSLANGALRHLSIDCGFDPSTMTADTSSCVQANDRTTVEGVSLYNCQGSCLAGVGTKIRWWNNRIKDYGDHALYVAGNVNADGTPSAPSSDIVLHGNTITNNAAYHNGPGGAVRGAIKLRDDVSRVAITNNIIDGDICIMVTGMPWSANSLPRETIISNNTCRSTYAAVDLNTIIEAPDNGFRMEDVAVEANNFSTLSGSSSGVLLRNSRGRVANNVFRQTGGDGVTDFGTADAGRSVVSNNTFYASGTNYGVYSVGTGSAVEGNQFIGSSAGKGVYAPNKLFVRGNLFSGLTTGLHYNSAGYATFSEITKNTFTDCTTALNVATNGRQYTITGNTFINNTTTMAVAEAGGYSGMRVHDNHVLSGGAWPTVDAVSAPLVSTGSQTDEIQEQHTGAGLTIGAAKIYWGGKTALFPGVFRDGTTIKFRKADDSGYVPFEVGPALISGAGGGAWAVAQLRISNPAGYAGIELLAGSTAKWSIYRHTNDYLYFVNAAGTDLFSFSQDGYFRAGALAGTGNSLVCADLTGSLYRCVGP
jgi:hypothetical protein